MDMSKHKRCKGMGPDRRRKMIQGDVIGETFEFFNSETMEVVELKTVANVLVTHRCHKDCYFRKLCSFANDVEQMLKNAQKSSHPMDARIRNAVNLSQHYAHQNKLWPCYLHACHLLDMKSVRMEDGSLRKVRNVPAYYKEISKEKPKQEKNDGIE